MPQENTPLLLSDLTLEQYRTFRGTHQEPTINPRTTIVNLEKLYAPHADPVETNPSCIEEHLGLMALGALFLGATIYCFYSIYN
jgi:hypothetical protein